MTGNNEEKNQNQDMPSDGGASALKDKLEACEKQRDEYLAGWQRAKADFINYKKEELKHLEDIARYGSEELIKDMISVLDNFDLGLRQLEKAGPVEKGVYMIRTQIEDILRRKGLERIKLSIGEQFDPSLAEVIAVTDPPAGGRYPPGTILEEIEPGYRLYDKIIRPARIKVSK
ncbi:MAG: nucleotide exchange factor GrpE [bacterium]|nr:nucleotide exchange factor GrpE [bacterium]